MSMACSLMATIWRLMDGRQHNLVLQSVSYFKTQIKQTRAVSVSPLLQVLLLRGTPYYLTSNSSLLLKMTTNIFKLHSSKASLKSRVFTIPLALVPIANVALIATPLLEWMQKISASTLRIQFVHYILLLVINQERARFWFLMVVQAANDLGTHTFLRARGFHMPPGVPNATHVPQATDRNYGNFKSMYHKNLKDLVEYWQLHKL